MKSTAYLVLFFFILAFSTAADTVLDTDGKPIINNGSQYYIIPAFRGMGGGITLARVRNEKCPLTVVQASSELSNGLPVRISSGQSSETIKTGWRVVTQFMTVPPCSPKPSLWQPQYESSTLKIGADERLRGVFAIEKAYGAYNLSICPSSPSSCMELGIKVDEQGNRLLMIRGETRLIVRFKKAS